MYSYLKGDSVYVTILGCDTVIFLELTGIAFGIPVGYGLLCFDDSNKNWNLQPRRKYLFRDALQFQEEGKGTQA